MSSRPNQPATTRHRASRAALASAAGLALAVVGTSAAVAAPGSASAPQSVVPTACTVAQLLGNPGFEAASAAPWTTTPGVPNTNGAGETAHSGTRYAWMNGYGTTHTDTVSQTVSVPQLCNTAVLSFWLHIDTSETSVTTAFDKLTVQVSSSTGTTTLATFSNLNHATGYTQHSFSLAAFAGKSIVLKFTGVEDASLQTSFVVDDAAINVS